MTRADAWILFLAHTFSLDPVSSRARQADELLAEFDKRFEPESGVLDGERWESKDTFRPRRAEDETPSR